MVKLLMCLEFKEFFDGEELVSEGSFESSIYFSYMEGYNEGILLLWKDENGGKIWKGV